MSIKGIDQIVTGHPMFAGLDQEYLERISGCASNVKFEPGEYIFREGGPADFFYLLRYGCVALEAYVPGRGALNIQTRGEGDVIGWSAVFPPYQWHFDARALELTRAIAFDATCVRNKSEEDARFGYEMMKRFGIVLIDRLQSTRLQLLDLYAQHDAR